MKLLSEAQQQAEARKNRQKETEEAAEKDIKTEKKNSIINMIKIK